MPPRDPKHRSSRQPRSNPRRPTKPKTRREGGFGPHGPPREPERERRPDVEAPPRKPAPLRVKGERKGAGAKSRRERTHETGHPTRRRKRAPGDVETEILRLGGKRGPGLLDQLMAAADAYSRDRDREALRLVRPLGAALPESPSVRELTGLAHYRLGNYRAAAKELERFVELTNSVEQHPVLMDCARAQKRWRRVDELWEELAAASPDPALVTEGRIVAAGALADLEERAGNNARARALFDRVYEHDREFADVATRRRSIGR